MDCFFSVIIPVYNTEKYLRECLDSVLSQDVMEMQIVCVNDGSTDNSLDILEEYQAKDSRVIVISQKNKGLAGARNTGIKNAEGKYILFLDSDDLLYKGALGELLGKLKNNELEILLYDADCRYERKKTKADDYKDGYYHRKRSYGGPMSGQAMFAEQVGNDDLCDSACLMAIDRRWLIEKEIFFKQGMFYEDCLFVFQCFMIAEKVQHINRPLMIYRVREGSIMTSTPKYENIKSRLICYYEILGYALSHDLPPEVMAAVSKFAGMVMRHLKDMDCQVTVEERKKTVDFSPVEDFLAESMEIGLYGAKGIATRIPLLGLRERVREAEAVVIYGAGKVGTLVYRFLKRNSLSKKVRVFAVTDGADNRKIDGIPVVNLADKCLPSEALLLIAAGLRFQWDMLQAAQENGFYDMEVISRELELQLEAAEEEIEIKEGNGVV